MTELEQEYYSLLGPEQRKLYDSSTAEQKQAFLQAYNQQKANQQAAQGERTAQHVLGNLLLPGIYSAIMGPAQAQSDANAAAIQQQQAEIAAKAYNDLPKEETTELNNSTVLDNESQQDAATLAQQISNENNTSAATKALNAGVNRGRAGLLGSTGNAQQALSSNLQSGLRSQKASTQADYLNKQGDINALQQQYNNAGTAGYLGAISSLLTGGGQGLSFGNSVSDENEKTSIEKYGEISDDEILLRIKKLFELNTQLNDLRRRYK